MNCMGRSRYPRRGHRIAPAALSDLLRTPVPEGCFTGPADAGLLLCDLDESSWERFDEPTCRALGAAVIRAVGRAARMPLPIGERKLPSLPPGVHVTDLDLEVRTLNCLVAAGIHQRPQDLETLHIDGLLTLRGFWVKCLVDLLTSLEYVIDHPEARRALRQRNAGHVHARAMPRLPQVGLSIAPETLREILTDPLPSELVAGTPGRPPSLRPAEDAWGYLDREAIDRLADIVVSRVNMSGYTRAVQERRVPERPRRAAGRPAAGESHVQLPPPRRLRPGP